MITCLHCGAENALSDVLAEQFRHETETRLAELARQAEARARADFATEKQFLEAQIVEERKKRQAAQKAELKAAATTGCPRRARSRTQSRSRPPRRCRKVSLEQSIRRGSGSQAAGKG